MRNNALNKREQFVISQLYEIARLREVMAVNPRQASKEASQMRLRCDENLNPLLVWDKALKALEADLDGK